MSAVRLYTNRFVSFQQVANHLPAKVTLLACEATASSGGWGGGRFVTGPVSVLASPAGGVAA